jgi:recombination protein RecT
MSANAVVAQKQKFSVAITTDAYKRLISNTLQDPARAQRFVASITSAVAVNPALQECTPPTIIAGALLGESLNLSPSPQLGQYYLVPFECRLKDREGKVLWQKNPDGSIAKDKNGRQIAVTEKRAQFVLGYKGYIQLAIRSGQYSDIDVMDIREGEYLGKDPQTGKPRFHFIEDDEEREKLAVIGYMAYFEYLNGFRKVLYWSKEKMLAHADKYSPAFSAEAYRRIQAGQIADQDMWKYSSFWYKNFDDMAKKTLLRQLISRWGIMSIEMQKGYVGDSNFIQVENGEFVNVPGEEVDGQQSMPAQEEPPASPAPAEAVNLADL